MVRIILYLLIIITFSFGCLKKQNYRIEEPVWPRYRFEGWFIHQNGDPEKGARVIIEFLFFIFPDSMSPETTFTDTTGYFDFGEIPASHFRLRVFRYGEMIYEDEFVIQKDRKDTIYLNP